MNTKDCSEDKSKAIIPYRENIFTINYDILNQLQSNKILNEEEIKASIKELNYQFKSLSLMNENIYSKLQDFSNKEIIQVNTIKTLDNENEKRKLDIDKLADIIKEGNETIIKKLESLDKRLQIFENANSTIIQDIDIKLNESCLIIEFQNGTNVSMLERNFKRKNKAWKLIEFEGQFKVFDIKWFMENMNSLFSNCSKILFDSIKEFDIIEDIIISNNLILSSTFETNLNFLNDSKITINESIIVEMSNFNVMNIKNEVGSLFNIKRNGQLMFKKGFIENNTGNRAIFELGELNGKLDLNSVIFKNNIIINNNQSSCIYALENTDVNLYQCQFTNHNSETYPNSSLIIYSKGNLNIKSTLFENNQSNNEKSITIQLIGNRNEILTLNDVKYEKCSQISIEKYHSINIKNSDFMNNTSLNLNGGCLGIQKSNKININECKFRKNHSNLAAGAIEFLTNKKTCKITNCSFKENSTGNGNNAGAILSENTELKIENSNFIDNLSERNGGAISVKKCNLSCGNCTFKNNNARGIGRDISFCSGKLIEIEKNRFD